jgi:hypothetical protein
MKGASVSERREDDASSHAAPITVGIDSDDPVVAERHIENGLSSPAELNETSTGDTPPVYRGSPMLAGSLDLADLLPFVALALTLVSFWWIWLRRGRLHVSAPLVYASATGAQQVRIRFPLVFHNTGAVPIVVDNLRLHLDGREWEWMTVRSTLRPRQEDSVDFARPFAVAGRSTLELVVEFGGSRTGWQPAPGRGYDVAIERLTRGDWRELVAFTWWAPTKDAGSYIAHRNQEGDTIELDEHG